MSEQVSKIIDQLQQRINEANQKAETIVQEAEAKAQKILADAQAKAVEKLKATDEEIQRRKDAHDQKVKQAVRDTLIELKQNTINAVLSKTLNETIVRPMKDESTVEKAILAMCTEFAKTQQSDLRVLLGTELYEKLGETLQKKAHQTIKSGLNIKKDSRIKAGFKIGPADQGYVFDFSDDALVELFSTAYGQRIEKQIFAGE